MNNDNAIPFKIPRGLELAERTDAMIAAAINKAGLKDEKAEYCASAMYQIRDLAAQEGWGAKRIADAIKGVSASTVSTMYNGTYPGNWVKTCQRFNNFLAAREAARVYGRMDAFVQTRIGQGLWRLLERTKYNHRIQLLESPEQLGKTRVSSEYARQEDSRTIKVTCQDSGTSSPFSLFLRDLAEACGLSTDHAKILDIRFRIRNILDNIDLIIIDEFHKLDDWPDKAVKAFLDYLRTELHADGARGIVLISTNRAIHTQLSAFSRRSGYNTGQLLGRCCNDARSIDPADIPIEDVAALVNRYYAPGKRTLNKLHQAVIEPGIGHFGFLLDILDQAWAEHKLNEQPMTDTLVEECLKDSLESIKNR